MPILLASTAKSFILDLGNLARTLWRRVLQQVAKVSFWTYSEKWIRGVFLAFWVHWEGGWRAHRYLVPLVVDFLLLVDITSKEVLIRPQEGNGRMLVVNKGVCTISRLENAMLLKIGMIVLGVLLCCGMLEGMVVPAILYIMVLGWEVVWLTFLQRLPSSLSSPAS